MTPAGELRGSRPIGQVGLFDVVLACGLLAAGLCEIWLLHTFTGQPLRSTAAITVAALPLVWRRRAPLPVALVEAAGLVATAPASGLSQAVCVLVAVFGVAAYASLPAATAGFTAVVVGQAAAVGLGPDPTVLNVVFGTVLYGAAWVAGLLVRRLGLQIAELRRLTREVREEQQLLSSAALAAERARIARELHDVIAHSVSVMVVQAGAAEQLVESDPEATRRALDAVQTTGEQTAAELRRLLGVLRTGSGGDDTEPAPGLASLPRLVADVRSTGLAVDLAVRGVPRPLPAGADLAIYRVAQEALTNVLKHARASTVTVTVDYSPRGVSLEVADDGGGRASTGPGPGHGLVGMRERCALYGGTLTTDSGPGGFRVTAWLPREDAATLPEPRGGPSVEGARP